MLEMLKNGSGIHIKKKNRGSFRRWCGGDVTDECIRRGKNSPNPKIRKKQHLLIMLDTLNINQEEY